MNEERGACPGFGRAARCDLRSHTPTRDPADPGAQPARQQGDRRRRPGPARLEREYRHFLGYRFGAELAAHLSGADALVFPSPIDTFGLVMLEAMACGLPVAALPVTGPKDVVIEGTTGVLDEDLARACHRALELDRAACRRYAESRSWQRSTEQFASWLAPLPEHAAPPSAIGRTDP